MTSDGRTGPVVTDGPFDEVKEVLAGYQVVDVESEARAVEDLLRELAPIRRLRRDTLMVLLLSCHPALSPAAAVALALRAEGGLRTAEIAAAFGVAETTMARGSAVRGGLSAAPDRLVRWVSRRRPRRRRGSR